MLPLNGARRKLFSEVSGCSTLARTQGWGPGAGETLRV